MSAASSDPKLLANPIKMYNWRKMTGEMRSRVLNERKVYRRPWHSPPHFEYAGETTFIITAACFEHRNVIGKSPTRMAECETELIELCRQFCTELNAWCILPNHYHLLTRTVDIKQLLAGLGRYHGSTSFKWNGEDNSRGRKVWYRTVERSMRSDRHFYATLNYIHHNPVKHGYVEKWQEWPYSSARDYLEKVGAAKAAEVWKEYPILDYGKGWDP